MTIWHDAVDMGFDFTGMDQPTTWLVCFHSRAHTWWVRAIPGRYKHVSAIGLCPLTKVWIGFDPAIDRTRIWVVKDGPQFAKVMGPWVDDALIVAFRSGPGHRLRPWSWCVPAVAHLIGLPSGALRPDTLLRDCLRHGGRIIADDHQDEVESSSSASASG